jgi:hypothetical protein
MEIILIEVNNKSNNNNNNNNNNLAYFSYFEKIKLGL